MAPNMKKIKEIPAPPPPPPVTEIVTEQGGFEADLGHMVLIMCTSYNYYGKLVGVNCSCLELENPYIVYETGAWSAGAWKDAQKLPSDTWTIQYNQIESHGRVTKSVK